VVVDRMTTEPAPWPAGNPVTDQRSAAEL